MTDAARLAWLRLARTDGIGPRTFAHLLERFGTATKALEAVPDLAKAGGRKGFKLCSEADARREFERAAAIGARLYIGSDTGFPALLGAIDPPPPLFYLLGQPDILARDAVAMVGARNASAAGRKLAEDIAAGLGSASFVVVSGLARGLDTAAHNGALSTGTIAVLAGGVDNIYPPENARLHARIQENGAIVSEMPPGFSPMASHFPRRNRTISGLARGTVVVEAAIGSGSLITARHALEQNREVFAVPGSPLDPRSRGTNHLIRQGATLTESADDVLHVLAAMPTRLGVREQPAPSPAPTVPGDSELGSARAAIDELLGPVPLEIDELIRRSGQPPDAVMTVLLELELAGKLHRSSGQRVALV